jgi:hypothetical protein
MDGLSFDWLNDVDAAIQTMQQFLSAPNQSGNEAAQVCCQHVI